MVRYLRLPLEEKIIRDLVIGDYVYITGTIFSARDAAHKRMYEALMKKEKIPVDWKNSAVYYMGPTPAREGKTIGSAGPTTASRMDMYTPLLLEQGLKIMIGKGRRCSEVINAISKHCAVYLGAVGGAGALLSSSIVTSEVVAYDDLGAEAIHKLQVKDFPCIVVVDTNGNNLYDKVLGCRQ